ncbi:unnamed protein product, partial [Mesorhabditis spiculigera]
MFITITGLSFNWAINVDLQMSVVVPWRRNSSNAWQILISHLFGDAAGPYLIGMLSDRFREHRDTPWDRFVSLRTAFYIPNAMCLLSVILFFVAALTVLRDQAIYRREMGLPDDPACPSSSRRKSQVSCISALKEKEAIEMSRRSISSR